ncbi:hypothetical protein WAF17_21035 [Bernardetia sp. ABR2-2B]|uniref:hypothetical protein n=1 Tax=Bernardetia sp. ABR2-2B TaxID=3127472 RepID=UPI0030D2E8EC
MENNQTNTVINLTLTEKDAKAIILGRKLLTFASEKDISNIIDNAIRVVNTQDKLENLRVSPKELSADLYQIRDLFD